MTFRRFLVGMIDILSERKWQPCQNQSGQNQSGLPGHILEGHKDSFCGACGSKEVERSVPGYFDRTTGMPKSKMVCIKPRGCFEGCRNTGGHRWSMLNGVCKNGCGAIDW